MRHRAVLAAAFALAACAGGSDRTGDGIPLFTTAAAMEVLVEEPALGEPASEAPNRFFRGWRPAPAGGRRALRSVPEGAGFQVVTVGAAPAAGRTLAVDLAGSAPGSRAGHVEVRIDDGPSSLVPLTDPLRVPLPADLSPGRHLVMLRPRTADQPPLVALGAAVRPAPAAGEAVLEGGDLVQTGPSLVDVPARPGAGAVLSGEVCPRRRLSGTGGLGVEVEAPDGRRIGGWSGTGSALGRLAGCRRIELPPLPSDDPVRVRFTARAPGAAARWTGWRWSGPSAPAPAEAPGAREPDAPLPPPRLVVVYVPDALRADAVGHLGGPPDTTPVLDRLAREGHTFRDHRSTAPNTLLSLRHLFPGRIVVNEAAWHALGVQLPTFAEAFRRAGYRTALVSGNSYLGGPFGLDRGFERVIEVPVFGGLEPHEPRVNRNAEEVHAAALDWLDGLPSGSRALLYLQTIHPHNPYAPPPDLERRFTAGIPSTIRGTTPVLRSIARGRLTVSAADRDRLRGLYAASLAYNDAELGRLLDALADRYPEEEVLLAVTSDHGEELFDHGGALHGYTLYEELLRIPLVVWAPGRVPPGETSETTDNLDLHATLVELVAGTPGGGESEGRSLLGRWTGRDSPLPPRPHFAASDGPPGGAFAVRWGRFKHVRVRGNQRTWAMGLGPARSWDREYLFDLEADPGERKNLAGTGGVREAWLRALLRVWTEARLAEGRGGEGAPPPALDEATERGLRALGYLD